jgi:predicted ATPase
MVNKMLKFENLSVKGFRRLQNINLEMRDLTVMIGANGSGKTSFLDVMSILAASANGKLNEVLQSKGGLNEILTRGKAESLEIDLLINASEQRTLKYSLSISPQGLSYTIKHEELVQQRDSTTKIFANTFPLTANLVSPKYIESYGLDIKYFQDGSGSAVKPNWEHNPLETSLSQVPKMYQEPEKLRKSLASCTYYGALDVSEKSLVRLPQAMRPAKLPGAKGENLVSCLYDLRESDRDRFEMVENIISTAFPDFVRLNFPPVAAGTISMTWTDRNFSQPIYVHELSEGTLRFLWLVALLQSQNLTTITLLDSGNVERKKSPVIKFENETAAKNDLSSDSNKALCSNEKVIALIQGECDRLNASFSNYEMIKKFKLLPAEWSVTTGELTPKLSLKRRVIHGQFAKEIEAFYE